MRRVFDEHGYILDPHTAVGWLALEEALAETPDAHGVVLATAHPAKFGDIVEEAIGDAVPVQGATGRGRSEALALHPNFSQLAGVAARCDGMGESVGGP